MNPLSIDYVKTLRIFLTMIDAGISKKKRQDKALVDKISATLILQSYMQQLEIESIRQN